MKQQLMKFLSKKFADLTNTERDFVETCIEWLESLPEPEPLDPYTCELRVGDVVELSHTLEQALVWKVGEMKNISQTNTKVVHVVKKNGFTVVYPRKIVKLAHRNGAVIKEVQ